MSKYIVVVVLLLTCPSDLTS